MIIEGVFDEREELLEYEQLLAAESAYDGYIPLAEEELDGYQIIYDNM